MLELVVDAVVDVLHGLAEVNGLVSAKSVRAKTHPVVAELVAPIGTCLLDVARELLLLVFWDLRERDVCDVEDALGLSARHPVSIGAVTTL